MKEVRLYPQERQLARLEWVKRAATALVLLLFLTAYAPSRSQSAPVPGAKTSAPGAGSPATAEPKDLPSKGSPGAKLVMVVFTEFH